MLHVKNVSCPQIHESGSAFRKAIFSLSDGV